MPSSKWLAFSAGLAAALSWPSSARAQSPAQPEQPPERRVRLELDAGWALGRVPIATGEHLNAYGTSVGLAGGYRFPFGLYAGLHYERQFGRSSSYWFGPAGVEYAESSDALLADIGYEWRPAMAIVRPRIGLGVVGIHHRNACTTTYSTIYRTLGEGICAVQPPESTDWRLALAPGLLMGLRLSRYHVFVEPRYIWVKDASAYGLYGGVGVSL